MSDHDDNEEPIDTDNDWDNLTDIMRQDGVIGPEDRWTGVISNELEILKDQFDVYDQDDDDGEFIGEIEAQEAVVNYYHDNPAMIKPPEGMAFFSIRRKGAPADEMIVAERKYITHGI